MDTFKLKDINLTEEPYIQETPIMDLLIVKRPRYIDNRGLFQEQFRLSAIEEKIGRKIILKQLQISVSKQNVIRGIHFEPQDKIVTPLTGRVFCVYLDLRKGSRTFKKMLSLEIDNTVADPQLTTVFVPEGVGNSLCVFRKSDDPEPGSVTYQYSVTEEYDPATAGIGVKYNDPDLNIAWPVKEPIVSERDKSLLSLKEFLEKYR